MSKKHMIQVNIKFNSKDLELIKKISSKRGETYSDFIRVCMRKELAILGFLTKDETKALGVELL